jgi:hypothetical protein
MAWLLALLALALLSLALAAAAENIAKGKMSAAYWADKVKW